MASLGAFASDLVVLRETHVATKNAQYHAEVHELIEAAKVTLDFDVMRQTITKWVTNNPEASSVSHTYELAIETLFHPWHVWPDSKMLPNPVPPLELWVSSPMTASGPRVSGQTSMHRIVLATGMFGLSRDILIEYMLATDPDVQSLRTLFLEAFPDADLIPRIDTCSPATLRIEQSKMATHIEGKSAMTLRAFATTLLRESNKYDLTTITVTATHVTVERLSPSADLFTRFVIAAPSSTIGVFCAETHAVATALLADGPLTIDASAAHIGARPLATVAPRMPLSLRIGTIVPAGTDGDAVLGGDDDGAVAFVGGKLQPVAADFAGLAFSRRRMRDAVAQVHSVAPVTFGVSEKGALVLRAVDADTSVTAVFACIAA